MWFHFVYLTSWDLMTCWMISRSQQGFPYLLNRSVVNVFDIKTFWFGIIYRRNTFCDWLCHATPLYRYLSEEVSEWTQRKQTNNGNTRPTKHVFGCKHHHLTKQYDNSKPDFMIYNNTTCHNKMWKDTQTTNAQITKGQGPKHQIQWPNPIQGLRVRILTVRS